MAASRQHETIAHLRAELAAAHTEIAQLRITRDGLSAALAVVHQALSAAEADIARYRALVDERTPNVPERVPSREQQQALEALVKTLEAAAPPPGNDAPSPITGAAALGTITTAAPPAPGQQQPPSKRAARRAAQRAQDRARAATRRKLADSELPKHVLELHPAEVLAARGVGFEHVGVEITRRIATVPTRFVLLEILRHTYKRVSVRSDTPADADADADAGADAADVAGAPTQGDVPPQHAPFTTELLTAPLPLSLVAHALADASAVADVIVGKYDDSLPLHRQERISRRGGCTIPRSTACNWLGPAHAVLRGIVDAMLAESTTGTLLALDATSARVRPRSRAPCEHWQVVVIIADDAHVVFRAKQSLDSATLTELLRGFSGTLLGDAASIYSPLVTAGMVVHAACWAHVRRYAFKALGSDSARAMEAIAIIGQLFDVERDCRTLSGDEKTRTRAAGAAPVLAHFDAWLARSKPHADPRSPLAALITYAENQRVALRRFLTDGRIRIDNNLCEGALRSLVLGLNNWRYFETGTGLHWYATFRSLIASCHLHGLCPLRYLECVLRLAPYWSQLRLLELSPRHWRATAQKLTPEQLEVVRPAWSEAFDAFVEPTTAAPADRDRSGSGDGSGDGSDDDVA